jgi:cytosine/adenosine deaminase-related metal-dependent hydrolase
LFRRAAAASEHLAVHCAEVPEEQEFLHTGSGAFAALLARIGRLPAGFRAPGVGAVRWLEQLGVLRAGTQLVHCQELERGDAARIAAAGASIAVCPGTIEWFRRAPPPVPSWLRLGIPVALGTDSRASNAGFSMLAELQRACRFWPGLSPAQLFAMATLHGGAALGNRGLGSLRRSGRADFLAVPAGASFDRTLEHFVQGALPPVFVVCRGSRHAVAAPAR